MLGAGFLRSVWRWAVLGVDRAGVGATSPIRPRREALERMVAARCNDGL